MLKKSGIFLVCYLIFTYAVVSQAETKKWKAIFAVGVNAPSKDGFVEDFSAKPINFPTITLGLQHMFKQKWGGRLDFNYNRFTNSKNTPEFKTNYSRINTQIVYEPTASGNRVSSISVVAHAGPGYSFITPLDIYKANKTSFFNTMAGVEFHYALSKTVSIFTDVSYIYGFSADFNPVTDGYGSFNGNLLTITLGASLSLSGCYYCN